MTVKTDVKMPVQGELCHLHFCYYIRYSYNYSSVITVFVSAIWCGCLPARNHTLAAAEIQEVCCWETWPNR